MTSCLLICMLPLRNTLLGLVLTINSYNDDEPAGKAARAPEVDQYSAVQSATDIKNEDIEDGGQQQDYNNNGGEVKYEEEEEDDDDEIDFNLGNGPSTAVAHHEHHDNHDRQEDDDEKPTYNAPAAPIMHTKGPNAKEDG